MEAGEDRDFPDTHGPLFLLGTCALIDATWAIVGLDPLDQAPAAVSFEFTKRTEARAGLRPASGPCRERGRMRPGASGRACPGSACFGARTQDLRHFWHPPSGVESVGVTPFSDMIGDGHAICPTRPAGQCRAGRGTL